MLKVETIMYEKAWLIILTSIANLYSVIFLTVFVRRQISGGRQLWLDVYKACPRLTLP